ncbi:amidase domain-containing protein [Microbacterium betulae]|uniref:Amidase domain-containing protein n=1 Tax=Microbacterium betulae TaxID=2981139 RepID=A0AA97I7Z7_9MICO|nr:amidase domain-containing protein [Microbacterium sp. AB]WOF24167.1 amidase domain-containing protein [Microbacterium sp. AB]
MIAAVGFGVLSGPSAEDPVATASPTASSAPASPSVSIRAGEPDDGAADAEPETRAAPAEAAVSPALTGLSSTSGSLVAGETLALSGTGLSGVDDVRFGETSASIVSVEDESVEIVVPHAPDYTAGEVAVTALVGDAAVDTPEPLAYLYEARTGVDRQLEYALAHWDDYNVDGYGDYNPLGGDCMNFASQTLVARGWQQSADWYNDGSSATTTWTYVPAFETWIQGNAEALGVTRLELDQRDEVKVGDLVMFDWDASGALDHVQVVSEVVREDDGSVSIRMVGHNEDSDYRDLDEALTVDHPGGTAYFWSIPDDS